MNSKQRQSDESGHRQCGFFAELFNRFSKLAASFTGHPLSFCLALMIVFVWGVSGPLFQFSDTWQLVINTGTTIVTFLMVFLIQNTQNRDSAATQIKLDELIRSHKNADRKLLDLEELDEATLEKIRQSYEQMAADARRALHQKSTSSDEKEP